MILLQITPNSITSRGKYGKTSGTVNLFLLVMDGLYLCQADIISVVANSPGGSSLAQTMYLNVIQVDTSVTVNGNTLTADDSTSIYQWMDCATGQFIPGEVNRSFTPTADGIYAVIVTDSGCVDTSSCYQVVLTGLCKNKNASLFTIRPNPSGGIFHISSKKPLAEIEIYNVLGELILRYSTYKLETMIDISDKQDGIYFLNVIVQDKRQNGVIIKKE